MDLDAAIRALKADKRRLDEIIVALEKLTGWGSPLSTPAKRKRGRKQMGQEERQLVSERMRRYWEAKKQADRKPVECRSERKRLIPDSAGVVRGDIEAEHSGEIRLDTI